MSTLFRPELKSLASELAALESETFEIVDYSEVNSMLDIITDPGDGRTLPKEPVDASESCSTSSCSSTSCSSSTTSTTSSTTSTTSCTA